jgi:hypothetical protein
MVLSINIFQYGYKNQREGVNIPGFWTRMQTLADDQITLPYEVCSDLLLLLRDWEPGCFACLDTV